MDHSVSARRLASLLSEWRETTGRAAGYESLAQRVRHLILDGRVATAVRLPAERELAAALHVSRGTVAAAYERLRELGYLHTRRGAGSWSMLPAANDTGPSTPFAPHGTGPDVIDLAHASPAAPLDAVHRAARDAAEALPHHLLSHGYDLLGTHELRQVIADRFARRGLPTSPDQVMVTSGAQHALALLIGALTGAGDRAVLEHPTYPNAVQALARRSVRPVPVALGDDGWDLEGLDAALRSTTPRLLYVIADHQNPTGLLMSEQQRRELVRMARRYGTALVVDETLVDIHLDEPGPLPPRRPVAALGGRGDSEAPVVTVGSASKSLWGGLRIGWIRAPRTVLDQVAGTRAAVDLSTPVVDQLIATALLSTQDSLLAPRLDRFAAQRDHLIHALGCRFPRWRVRSPSGGLSLWVDMGRPFSSALASTAEDHGLQLAAGPAFGVGGAFENHLRLPFVHPPAALDEAVTRLGRAWEAVTGASASPPRLRSVV